MEGQPAVVMEIKIEGDKMTWLGITGGTAYVYNRVKVK